MVNLIQIIDSCTWCAAIKWLNFDPGICANELFLHFGVFSSINLPILFIMNHFFGVLLIALVVTSCQNSASGKAERVETGTNNLTTVPAPVVDTGKPGTTVNSPVVPIPAPVNAVNNAAGNNKAAVALNPEHGAPGHRCDIAVGAPLTAAAVNGAVPGAKNNVLPTMQVTPNQAPAPAAKKGVRLNPAHGEPGHDCSIQVGQPLKN